MADEYPLYYLPSKETIRSKEILDNIAFQRYKQDYPKPFQCRRIW